MSQIDKKDCTSIGYVQKTHGLTGEVIVLFEDEFADTIESAEYFFIELEGGLVPFFISEKGFRYRNNESVIIKFDFVDSQAKAKELAGCKLFVFNSDLNERDYPEIYSDLVGMKVVDNKMGDIGQISRIDDYSGNIVITVLNPRAEILIPLSGEIITKVDEKRKKLYLNCPEGLIDIYLE